MLTLKPKQLQAIELLNQGFSHVATANKLGVDRTTITRWLKQPEFQQLMQKLYRKKIKELLS